MAFEDARDCVLSCFVQRLRLGATYTGFSEASRRHSPRVLAMVLERSRELVEDIAARSDAWETLGWVVIGSDGTRVAAPRTTDNIEQLGGLGRDALNPQMWLTMLLHLASGLPWAFTVERGDSSERNHLLKMLGCLPKKSLLVADAGYVGYGLWRTLIENGQPFLIRVGSNVTLIKGLTKIAGVGGTGGTGGIGGREAIVDGDVVWLWPRCGSGMGEPLMLRLIGVWDAKKKTKMYLVTNVLSKKRLPESAAAEFYRMRWGLEVCFRSLKQTMGKRKMRSHAPDQAKMELSWAAVGLLALGLMQTEALLGAGWKPSAASCAEALKVARRAMKREAKGVKRPMRRRRLLMEHLSATVKDSYVRMGPKQVRSYPKKKRRRPPGPPEVRAATRGQKRRYKDATPITIAVAFTA
jgi:hypothetical protein